MELPEWEDTNAYEGDEREATEAKAEKRTEPERKESDRREKAKVKLSSLWCVWGTFG